MKFNKICGRFCSFFWRCLNHHEGECLGYVEEDDETDDAEEMLERTTY